jgi:hypothetical protein
MDKVNMLSTLQQLQVELTRRLEEEVSTGNNADRIDEYKRQLQQIQTEVDRITRGRSYS